MYIIFMAHVLDCFERADFPAHKNIDLCNFFHFNNFYFNGRSIF